MLLPYDEYRSLLERYKIKTPNKKNLCCAVINPIDPVSMQSCAFASQLNIMRFLLVGDTNKIKAVSEQNNIDISACEIVDASTPKGAAEATVNLVKDGKAQIISKGQIDTSEMMRPLLAQEAGLKKNGRISHIFLMLANSYHKPFIITDSAINIAPDMATKKEIINNSIDAFIKLYETKPKVAILSSSEKVKVGLQSSIDAAILSKALERERSDCIVDGPLAFDNAFSLEAAKTKGLSSPVSGDADIFVMPNLDSGNIAYKQMKYMSHARGVGLVLGTKVPIVLLSRAGEDMVSHLLSYNIASRLA